MNMSKIMIIDDSEADQFLALAIIEDLSIEIDVLQAYDGQEALKILDTIDNQPDVIFLDINMPVMNGHEFLVEYDKRETQTSVVVMLTSSYQEQDRQQSRAFECVKQYFTKPLELEDLETLLKVGNDDNQLSA